MVKTSKTFTFPFNIFIDVRYHKIKVVGDKATLQASTTSLGKFVLFIEEDIKMLI